MASGESIVKAFDQRRLDRRAKLLKSLAHPSRLLIVEMLEKRPCCVSELTEAIGADITTVSKHLTILRNAGLVRDQKRGTYSDYTLVCNCVTHFVDCIEKGMDEEGHKKPKG
jgi:ArsR family transcriptional regulator